MSTNTLTPRALYEQVAEKLRLRIFEHELAPGDWIDELKIAEEYGISRTPLREALKVLAAEGLVTMKVRRGAYVTEVSSKDIADVYHLLSLQPLSVRGREPGFCTGRDARGQHHVGACSQAGHEQGHAKRAAGQQRRPLAPPCGQPYLRSCGSESKDRKSTRLNSSHQIISYAVFCLKKKTS